MAMTLGRHPATVAWQRLPQWVQKAMEDFGVDKPEILVGLCEEGLLEAWRPCAG